MDIPTIHSARLAARQDAATRYGVLPPHAHAAKANGLWDATRFVYNQKPANTRRLREFLGRGLSGMGNASLLIKGDSTTAGFQGNVVAPELNSLANFSALTQLRKQLKAAGYKIKGTGPVGANPRGASWTSIASKIDPRFTFTGTWTNQASNVNGIIETTNGIVEFTDTEVTNATVVEFAVPLLNASFEWFVDNVSQGTVVQSGATGAIQRHAASGLTPGVHTLRIVRTAGTLRLAWCEIRDGANGGIQIGNLAVGGSTTAIWDRTEAYFPGPLLTNCAPTICGHDLGINDWGNGTTPSVPVATYKATMLSLLTKTIASGAEPFIITPNPTDAKDYAPYLKALYELADQLDIWLWDQYAAAESYAVMHARTLMSDQTHPNHSGYAIKSLGLYRALTGVV